jgi:hypothetical protein
MKPRLRSPGAGAKRAARLQRRFVELCDEIRAYPAPIARCDEQLGELLQRRARVRAELQALQRPSGGCRPTDAWINDGGQHAA